MTSQQCAEKKGLMLIMILGHDSSVHNVYLGRKGKDDFYTTSKELNGDIESSYDHCILEGLD